MRSDVEYSPVGEGLGMRDFWLYVWLRRVAVIATHVTGLGLTLVLSLLSRPGTSKCCVQCFIPVIKPAKYKEVILVICDLVIHVTDQLRGLLYRST